MYENESEEPTVKTAEDEEMQGDRPDTTMTPPELRAQSRGEQRTETQEATSVNRLTTKSSTETQTATFDDEPVKQRLTGKQDTKNDEVLMPMDSVDSHLMHTVNTLLSDETSALEMNPF